ncbi:hypothetical protein CAC42_224 [Sphaceloma murrayae]|uniref:Uncharacterized protein n=1 Tax=Sphaceloma murrayae TaxID=2082308 RepID=A0A2K1QNQ0_9PEZI|nr:hypothetical protein CAC42_224 [Sphaceloma murrayae]
MSSRLLTMKFMQRASASRATPSSSAPESPASQPLDPATPSHPSKRQRLSNGTATPTYTPDRRRETEDERVVREAIEAEEAKRMEALDRLGREKGDTKWVLSTVEGVGGRTEEGPRFVSVGLGEIDRGGEERDAGAVGRRSFGKVVKERGRPGQDEGREEGGESGESGEGSGSSGESEEDHEPQDVDEMIQSQRGRGEAGERARREREERRRVESRQRSKLSSDRRGRDVNINSPRGGISSGGGSASFGRVRGGQRGKRKSY